MGASAPKPQLSIPPHCKQWGILEGSVNQNVARIHRGDLDIVRAAASWRWDYSNKSNLVVVADVPNPNTGLRVATTRTTEGAGIGIASMTPNVSCLSLLSPSHHGPCY